MGGRPSSQSALKVAAYNSSIRSHGVSFVIFIHRFFADNSPLFTRWIRVFDSIKGREIKGEMYMVRYADDFVCLFQYENEAQKFFCIMVERLKKFGLETAEDKSRIMPFGRYRGTKETFDFLGFTYLNGKSHWGKYCVVHRTSKKKLA